MLIILTTIFLGFLKSNSFDQKNLYPTRVKEWSFHGLHEVFSKTMLLSRQNYFHHHALIFIEIFDFKVQPIIQITLQQPIYVGN